MNSRPPVPQTGALTELRYAPSNKIRCLPSACPVQNKKLHPNCTPRCWVTAATMSLLAKNPSTPTFSNRSRTSVATGISSFAFPCTLM